ncbi:LexA family protein [Paenibacillus oleatilyticus]|uniref:LexA family protein n=1 Tax=Paenibacillus oleatilyticus TaxID=2594886 RepID=A0ABV4UXJ8_9BACL
MIQLNYHELLRGYIEKSGLSLSEISEALQQHGYKVSKGYISQLQNGKTENPATAELNRALAIVTGGDVDNLLTAALIEKAPIEIKEKFQKLIKLKELKNEYQYVIKESSPVYSSAGFVRVPVFNEFINGNLKASDGKPEHEYVHESLIKGNESFALKVQDEAMNGDSIFEGDTVICVKEKEFDSSNIVVISQNKEAPTLRRVSFQRGMCMLIPSNPKMQPSLVESNNLKIFGKIVEVRHRL